MVTGVLHGKPLPVEVLQQVVAKTDGVPLFVEEQLKMVLESELVREVDGRYGLTGLLPVGHSRCRTCSWRAWTSPRPR